MKIQIQATQAEFLDRGDDLIKAVKSLIKANVEKARAKDTPIKPVFEHPVLDAIVKKSRTKQTNHIRKVMKQKIDAVLARSNK